MNLPHLMPMLQQLIGEPSVSSVNPHWDQSNQKVIERLDQWFTDLGFQTEIQSIPDQPGKSNLIASIGSGPDGLVLSGHSDTVPFDDNRWNSNPFKITERDNRLYGLGTADMKSFFALIVEALRDIPLDKLKQPLTIVATADEESSMCGAQTLQNLGRKLGKHVVIGEPTGLRPIRSHKGITMEAIRLSGQSGHSSNPALGNNALEGMHLVIGELLKWRNELQSKYRNPLFEVDVPTMNLGHIHGGDNPNRICAHCELHVDLRPLPGMELDDLRMEMENRLAAVIENTGLELAIERLFSGIPPMETPAEAAIIQAVEQLTGHTSGSVAFATEAPYFNGMGMETVVLGPGSIDQAHQPDEYIALDQINPAIELIRKLIARFCL